MDAVGEFIPSEAVLFSNPIFKIFWEGKRF